MHTLRCACLLCLRSFLLLGAGSLHVVRLCIILLIRFCFTVMKNGFNLVFRALRKMNKTGRRTTVNNEEETQDAISKSEGKEEVLEGLDPPTPASEEGIIPDLAPPPMPDALELARIVEKTLAEQMIPIVECLHELKTSADATTAEMRQSSKLYVLMTENRNRATLLLTKYTEMYEMLRVLAECCKGHVVEAESCSDFEKELLIRTGNFERIMRRTLSSFGVVPIWPQKNDMFDAAVHQCIATIEPTSPEDVPGAISACSKMGILQDGVVLKAADVIVFNTPPAQTDELTD